MKVESRATRTVRNDLELRGELGVGDKRAPKRTVNTTGELAKGLWQPVDAAMDVE